MLFLAVGVTMKHLPDLIVYIWLLPVVLQVLLPLVFFVVWQVGKVFKLNPVKREEAKKVIPSAGIHTA